MMTKWKRLDPCGHIVILDAINAVEDGCPICRTLEMRDKFDRRESWPERVRRWQGRGRDA